MGLPAVASKISSEPNQRLQFEETYGHEIMENRWNPSVLEAQAKEACKHLHSDQTHALLMGVANFPLWGLLADCQVWDADPD